MKDISELNTEVLFAVQKTTGDIPTLKTPVPAPSKDEILKRLSAIADNLNNNKLYPNDRWNRTPHVLAIHALRTALIQLSYVTNDLDTRIKVNEIIATTVDILGV